jgi:hypothetical protein
METFFYYGKTELHQEIEADLNQGMTQEKRSLFYNRSFGAGVPEYENYPKGLSLEIGMRYDIASWVARRNLEVSNGTNGTRDRRAATSQNAITITTDSDTVYVQVFCILYADYQNPTTIKIPFGGS